MYQSDGERACAIDITDLGSSPPHGSASLEAGRQIGNWVPSDLDDVFMYTSDSLARLALSNNGGFAGKGPDALLTILPDHYFGTRLYSKQLLLTYELLFTLIFLMQASSK